jgi:hypothetical protein
VYVDAVSATRVSSIDHLSPLCTSIIPFACPKQRTEEE